MATITSKGQVTIPTDVRAAFNLKAGDKLIFVPEGNRITVIPVRRRTITDFWVFFAPMNPCQTWRNCDADIVRTSPPR